MQPPDFFVTFLRQTVRMQTDRGDMNKLNTKPQPSSFALAIDSPPEPRRAQRFIVLVPPDSSHTAAAHRIWELATTTGRSVHLLGMCKDTAQEPALRRDLVTMSALIEDARVPVDVKVQVGTNWADIVKQNYQTGDMVVCLAEQHTGVLHRPLSQILQSNFNIPVYFLPGLHPQNLPGSNRLSQAMAWAGSIGIILAATILQIRITSLAQDWFQTALLILSVIAEAWLIGVWNSLFG